MTRANIHHHAAAEAERLRRASEYPAARKARQMTDAQIAADARTWQSLVDWLAGGQGAPLPEFKAWAEATRRTARAAMQAHIATPADTAKGHRARALAALARNMAIIATVNGTPNAIDAYCAAMDLAGGTDRRAAA